MKIRIIILAVLALASLAPAYVQAQAIGISLSSANTVVYTGDVVEGSLTLSRSESEGELIFSVQEEEKSGLIDVHNQEYFVIPDGENTAVFLYEVNASTMPVGEYETTVAFVVDRGEESLVGNVTAVQYGLKAKLHISVVERPDASVTLVVSDYPTLIDDVYVGVPTIKQTSEVDGTRLTVIWNVENHGKNPLEGILSDVIVTVDGITQYQKTVTVNEVVHPGGVGTQSVNFLMPGHAPSGTYTAVVKVGTHENQSSALVLQPRIQKNILVITSTVLAVIGIALFYRRSIVRRRH